MWPMTPVVHMTYRLWQLGRGSLLVSVLEGPAWLIYLQVSCLLPIKDKGWPGVVLVVPPCLQGAEGPHGFR